MQEHFIVTRQVLQRQGGSRKDCQGGQNAGQQHSLQDIGAQATNQRYPLSACNTEGHLHFLNVHSAVCRSEGGQQAEGDCGRRRYGDPGRP
jgi:hypothetical protein